jgi:hypothetical protein
MDTNEVNKKFEEIIKQAKAKGCKSKAKERASKVS